MQISFYLEIKCKNAQRVISIHFSLLTSSNRDRRGKYLGALILLQQILLSEIVGSSNHISVEHHQLNQQNKLLKRTKLFYRLNILFSSSNKNCIVQPKYCVLLTIMKRRVRVSSARLRLTIDYRRERTIFCLAVTNPYVSAVVKI